MSNIRYVLSNTVNFSSPGIQSDNSANTLPHIFGNKEFSFEVTFYANNNIGMGDVLVANVSISSAPSYAIVEPLSSSTMKITKDANTSLFEEGYTYSAVDANTLIQTIESVPLGELLTYDRTGKSIIAWDTPTDETTNSNAMEIGTFQFTIDDGINSNNNVTYNQTYFWDPEEGFQNFQVIIGEL